MNEIPVLVSAPHQTVWPERPVGPADVSQHYSLSLATLRSIVSAWRKRKRLRWKLEQLSKANPHLIDDIGLTQWQVEAEIAKPFWRG